MTELTDGLYDPAVINAEHKDLIHDIAFDYYGIRFATCSSDQFIKVWDLDPVKGEWKQSGAWKAHSGPVWKVTWAHPEFGHVIASCSFDRTVAVWEEIVSESGGQRHWARRTNLVDSRTSVTDVKFASRVLGLMLATCSTDGHVRIYEAPDSVNLSQWTLQHEISIKFCCSCISWNHLYLRDTRDRHVVKMRSDRREMMYQIPFLAVGSDDSSVGNNAKVTILHYSEYSRRWGKIESSPNVQDPVHDIAFAPKIGRSYELLAIATKDLRIYSVNPFWENGSLKFETVLVACFDDHNSSVWRLSWNNIGTVLSSSGDDGIVRFWKCFPARSESPLKKTVSGTSTYDFNPQSKSFLDEMEAAEKAGKTQSEYNNFLNSKLVWKCTTVIKADGRQTGANETAEASEIAPVPPPPPVHSVTTRYFKLATISNPAQTPWH